MLEVNCRLKFLLNPDTQAITVGEVVKLNCPLETGQNWPPANQLQVMVPSEQQYGFYVHQLSLVNPQELEILFTSVVVGDHQIQGIKLTDQGQEAYLIAPFNLKVKSVIDQQNPVKEPFGPMVIQNLMLPTNLIVTAAAIVVVLIIIGLVRFIKHIKNRRQIKAFAKLVDESLLPYQQLSQGLKVIRQSPWYWDKKLETQSSEEVNELVKVINLEFNIYIGRIYQRPLVQWSVNKQEKWFKKLAQSYVAQDVQLSKLWFEIKVLSAQPMFGRDLRYIYNHTIQWALAQKQEGGH